MQILQIIDSLELNGGSTMFLELVSGMRKHWPQHDIVPYVVSKTGKYGRRALINDSLPSSYNVDNLQRFSYNTFEDTQKSIRNAVIFHHVLGHTKPIKFHNSCKYYVVNHSLTNVKRLAKFAAERCICVCRFFSKKVQKVARLSPITILNGCADYYKTTPSMKDDRFVIGRCQRVVPSKFIKESINSSSFPRGYVQYIVGPVNHGKTRTMKGSKYDVFLGPIFDRQKKIAIIKSFDMYLHNARSPEGASMAILEALSCGVPVLARDVGGGVRELIAHNRNGFLFKNGIQLNNILKELTSSRLEEIKKQTREDFLQRLHITIALKRYEELL
ncbi:hypothetical protein LCGC14_0891890 [marine sediment metagenome]|uniref:Glycosyl transferase family 1 domain-containing protein n=1 Tax=marine sediment metagenome TaxID=412755 RepID=A0A0F9PJQ2_9ZZZZ